MPKKRNTARHLTRRRTQQNQNRKEGEIRNQRNLKIQLHVSQTDWGNIQA